MIQIFHMQLLPVSSVKLIVLAKVSQEIRKCCSVYLGSCCLSTKNVNGTIPLIIVGQTALNTLHDFSKRKRIFSNTLQKDWQESSVNLRPGKQNLLRFVIYRITFILNGLAPLPLPAQQIFMCTEYRTPMLGINYLYFCYIILPKVAVLLSALCSSRTLVCLSFLSSESCFFLAQPFPPPSLHKLLGCNS